MTDDAQPPQTPEEYSVSPDVIEEDIHDRAQARKLLEQHAAELDKSLAAHESRFSLIWIFVLMTGAAVVLALGRHLHPQVFAGVCGAAVLVTLALISALRIRWVVIHVAWWLLLGIYLLASGLAIVHRG